MPVLTHYNPGTSHDGDQAEQPGRAEQIEKNVDQAEQNERADAKDMIVCKSMPPATAPEIRIDSTMMCQKESPT